MPDNALTSLVYSQLELKMHSRNIKIQTTRPGAHVEPFAKYPSRRNMRREPCHWKAPLKAQARVMMGAEKRNAMHFTCPLTWFHTFLTLLSPAKEFGDDGNGITKSPISTSTKLLG